MKVKRSSHQIFFLIIVVMVAAVAACVTILGFHRGEAELEGLVSIVSLIIAFFAFYISVQTYTSIDTVNSMTKMEGNIMENERYKTNVVMLLRDFKVNEADDEKASGKKFVTKLTGLIKDQVTSGVRFADRIQRLMDYMVLLPYYTTFSSDEESAKYVKKEVNGLLAKLIKEVDDFTEISEGSSVLLQESVSLLNLIVREHAYESPEKGFGAKVWGKLFQKKEAGEDGNENRERVPGIRGALMKNPVSRFFYHEYMGLFYFGRAVSLLSKELEFADNEIYSEDNIRKVKDFQDGAEKNEARFYLDMAMTEYRAAIPVVEGDLMWMSLLYFNMAQAAFFRDVLETPSGAGSCGWSEYLDKAEKNRQNLNTLLSYMVKKGYLLTALKNEEKLMSVRRGLFSKYL